MGARKYWIGFNHVAGVGPLRLQKLREHFSTLEAAWQANPQALREAGLDRRTIANLLAARQTLNLDDLKRNLDQLGVSPLTLEDMDYPAVLKELPDAPPVLYVRGSLLSSDRWAVAVVGTRKATHYGTDAAYTLARALAESGVTVVSGLATGIDAAAHRGALDGGGRTLAVLPCGIDSVYPSQHRKLAEQIMNQGALLTEFPPGTQAEAKNFPPRNRIISGLSLGVVVVEAPEKSGALLTADSAGEQGREVFAVPGQATSPSSRGSNRLIQDGARLVITVDDILSELNMTRESVAVREETREIAPQSEQEAQLLAQLDQEPRHIDELCRATGLPVATVSSTLALMELKGMVRQAGAMQYVLSAGYGTPFMLD